MSDLNSKYHNETGILANTKNRTKTDAAKKYFGSSDSSTNSEEESRINYVEVDVEEITPRLINKYSQSRIERLAKSIRSTNNRLIHPIVLVKPEDLPEDSKLLQKIKRSGVPIDKKYIIVAGERRYRAWMLNRENDHKNFPGRSSVYDTITANILTAKEAKNEEIYYSDSNTESRQLTPVEAMLNIRDVLDTIKTNEEKRSALIWLKNGNANNVPDDPDEAAKKFNTLDYTIEYLERELGIKGWARGTVKQYLAVVNNCDEQIIDAIIDGSYTENQSRRLTAFDKEQQKKLLVLWKKGKKEEYEELIKDLESEKRKKKKRVTHRDAQRQIKATIKALKKEREKLDEIRRNLGSADKEEMKKVIKKIDSFIEQMEESENSFK